MTMTKKFTFPRTGYMLEVTETGFTLWDSNEQGKRWIIDASDLDKDKIMVMANSVRPSKNCTVIGCTDYVLNKRK